MIDDLVSLSMNCASVADAPGDAGIDRRIVSPARIDGVLGALGTGKGTEGIMRRFYCLIMLTLIIFRMLLLSDPVCMHDPPPLCKLS